MKVLSGFYVFSATFEYVTEIDLYFYGIGVSFSTEELI